MTAFNYEKMKRKPVKMRKIVSETPECPRCGRSTRLRMGSYGEFWGCSDYPRCSGTVVKAKDAETEAQAFAKSQRQALIKAVREACSVYKVTPQFDISHKGQIRVKCGCFDSRLLSVIRTILGNDFGEVVFVN